MRRAVFLDRDGVLVRDDDARVPGPLSILPNVPAALRALHDAGFLLVVCTNQPIVARGTATEADIAALHVQIEAALRDQGAPSMTSWRVCPHHPNATLTAYRQDCRCRKPRPGLIEDAARDFDVDVGLSFMVGDRISDIEAGARAGCKTVQVLSGAHAAPRIESPDAVVDVVPDFVALDLAQAAAWICAQP
ncbi:MAG: HAD family hydrolase [Deltaproteobacteria bacterium]|nr:HAD family hydrolase [Deltaproteobacteria bacterium]